jgi:hypothetical protein
MFDSLAVAEQAIALALAFAVEFTTHNQVKTPLQMVSITPPGLDDASSFKNFALNAT